MKTIKGSLGYVGFGVSAIISQGQQSLGPQIWKSGRVWQRREGRHDPVPQNFVRRGGFFLLSAALLGGNVAVK